MIEKILYFKMYVYMSLLFMKITPFVYYFNIIRDSLMIIFHCRIIILKYKMNFLRLITTKNMDKIHVHFNITYNGY